MDDAGQLAEVHRLEKLFHELDTNKDGRIDLTELTSGLHRFGYTHITEEQILVSLELAASQFVHCDLTASPPFFRN